MLFLGRVRQDAEPSSLKAADDYIIKKFKERQLRQARVTKAAKVKVDDRGISNSSTGEVSCA
jgi:hypothetical protein